MFLEKRECIFPQVRVQWNLGCLVHDNLTVTLRLWRMVQYSWYFIDGEKLSYRYFISFDYCRIMQVKWSHFWMLCEVTRCTHTGHPTLFQSICQLWIVLSCELYKHWKSWVMCIYLTFDFCEVISFLELVQMDILDWMFHSITSGMCNPRLTSLLYAWSGNWCLC
jgi:hypothetical protein